MDTEERENFLWWFFTGVIIAITFKVVWWLIRKFVQGMVLLTRAIYWAVLGDSPQGGRKLVAAAVASLPTLAVAGGVIAFIAVSHHGPPAQAASPVTTASQASSGTAAVVHDGPQQVTVQGAAGWQNAGFHVSAGERVVISYVRGQWNIGNWPYSDANGPRWGGQPYIAAKALEEAGDNPASAVEQMPNDPKGGLVAMIGGVEYYIGDHAVITASRSGQLLLCQNNSSLPSDQQTAHGSITVGIRPA
jgi:hypothetical protein